MSLTKLALLAPLALVPCISAQTVDQLTPHQVKLEQTGKARSTIRPDRQFVAVRILEVESPASGEREDWLDDWRTSGLNFGLRSFQVLRVNHHQRAVRNGGCGCESPAQASVVEAGVVRTVVREGP